MFKARSFAWTISASNKLIKILLLSACCTSALSMSAHATTLAATSAPPPPSDHCDALLEEPISGRAKQLMQLLQTSGILEVLARPDLGLPISPTETPSWVNEQILGAGNTHHERAERPLISFSALRSTLLDGRSRFQIKNWEASSADVSTELLWFLDRHSPTPNNVDAKELGRRLLLGDDHAVILRRLLGYEIYEPLLVGEAPRLVPPPNPLHPLFRINAIVHQYVLRGILPERKAIYAAIPITPAGHSPPKTGEKISALQTIRPGIDPWPAENSGVNILLQLPEIAQETWEIQMGPLRRQPVSLYNLWDHDAGHATELLYPDLNMADNDLYRKAAKRREKFKQVAMNYFGELSVPEGWIEPYSLRQIQMIRESSIIPDITQASQILAAMSTVGQENFERGEDALVADYRRWTPEELKIRVESFSTRSESFLIRMGGAARDSYNSYSGLNPLQILQYVRAVATKDMTRAPHLEGFNRFLVYSLEGQRRALRVLIRVLYHQDSLALDIRNFLGVPRGESGDALLHEVMLRMYANYEIAFASAIHWGLTPASVVQAVSALRRPEQYVDRGSSLSHWFRSWRPPTLPNACEPYRKYLLGPSAGISGCP